MLQLIILLSLPALLLSLLREQWAVLILYIRITPYLYLGAWKTFPPVESGLRGFGPMQLLDKEQCIMHRQPRHKE